MTLVEQVEEHVCGGGLVVTLPELPEPDVVDDEQVGSDPPFHPAGRRVVGEAGVEVVEQIDAASVAHRQVGLTGPKRDGGQDGLEQVEGAGGVVQGPPDAFGEVVELELAEPEGLRRCSTSRESPMAAEPESVSPASSPFRCLELSGVVKTLSSMVDAALTPTRTPRWPVR